LLSWLSRLAARHKTVGGANRAIQPRRMISSLQLRAESSYCNCREQTDDVPINPLREPRLVAKSYAQGTGVPIRD
jgi:hypothetical protein